MSTTSTAKLDTKPDADQDDFAERRFRRRATALIGIGAVFAIGGGMIAMDLALHDHDRIVKSFDGPVTAVSVDVSGGSVTIVGTDDSTASVELDIEGGPLRASHRETLEDGRLVIDSNCPLGIFTPTCATEYVVQVPSDVDVELRGDGANVDVSGVSGIVDVAINGGEVELTYDIPPAGLTARANGGNIDIVVPHDGGTEYRVDASSSGGSTDIDVRSDPTSTRVIDLHTSGGSISVVYGARS